MIAVLVTVVWAAATFTFNSIAGTDYGFLNGKPHTAIAVWNYAELPHALGCQGWFTARVSTCGELDGALKTAEQANGAAYIEVVTDAYEAPPLYKKLHENVKSFYNVQ